MAGRKLLFVLLIEHHDWVRDTTVKALEAEGRCRVVHVPGASEAIEQLGVMNPDLVLVNPEANGMLDLALVSRFQALVDLSGSEVVMTSGIPILSIDSVLPAKLAKLVD
jgi:DNA-binding NarL/FixJ family response regulator